jgi:hypothetical protein
MGHVAFHLRYEKGIDLNIILAVSINKFAIPLHLLHFLHIQNSTAFVVAEKRKGKRKRTFFFCIICTEMAMNITFQIGALAGTPIQAESITSASTGSDSSAAAAWKTPIPSIRCKIIKPETIEQKSQPTSPCRSPILSGSNGIRPDLSVACRAFATETLEFMTLDESKAAEEEKMYKEGKTEKEKGVPVYVMMPLDSVTMGNTLNRKKAMNASLQALKSAGVEGLMVDVWWGLVERDAPGVYNWGGYTELLEMAKRHGLKVQAVMSFHQCGGNVGDSCTYVLFPAFLEFSVPYLLLMSVKYTRCCWPHMSKLAWAVGLGSVRKRGVF